MDYLLMIYGDESMWDKITPEQQQQGAAAYYALHRGAESSGSAEGQQSAAPEWERNHSEAV